MTSIQKRQWGTAAVFGAAGGPLAVAFWRVAPVVIMPGWWALSIVVSVFGLPTDGWNPAPLVIAGNCMLYGALGFIVGRKSLSWMGVVKKGAIICALVALASLWFDVLLPKIRYRRYMDRMVRERVAMLERNPEDIYALHWLGFHHFIRTKRLAEAERFFAKVVAIESTKTDSSHHGQHSLVYLAIIYQTQGKGKPAVSMYRRFIDTDPDLDGDGVLMSRYREYWKLVDGKQTGGKWLRRTSG